MPAHRTGERSYARIDRDFPHQVALPNDICVEHNYKLIRTFCSEHGLHHYTRRVQAIWPDRKYQEYRLHCFADRASAELFQAHFGGEFFDPKRDRENGRAQGAWRRSNVWTRLLESGPLKVPPLFRD
jgi:hypothetical protein